MPSINGATWEIRFNCAQIEQQCDRLNRLQKILEQKIMNRQGDNLQTIISDHQEAIKIIKHSVEDIQDITDTIRRLAD